MPRPPDPPRFTASLKKKKPCHLISFINLAGPIKASKQRVGVFFQTWGHVLSLHMARFTAWWKGRRESSFATFQYTWPLKNICARRNVSYKNRRPVYFGEIGNLVILCDILSLLNAAGWKLFWKWMNLISRVSINIHSKRWDGSNLYDTMLLLGGLWVLLMYAAHLLHLSFIYVRYTQTNF